MLAEFSREEFLSDYFTYRPGEHVIIVSPTGGGKSYLMWQLLERAMQDHPDLRPVYFMPKPSDETTDDWAERLGLHETPVWPPKKKLFAAKPPGYVLWPQHPQLLDPDERHAVVGAQLRKGLDAQFWTPRTISLVDDAHSASSMYGLAKPIEEHLVNGRSNRSAIWLATQKPSGTIVSGGLTSYAWNSGSHLFLGKSPAEADVQKYSEISGIDPQLVMSTVRNLRTYDVGADGAITQWLYINKSGPFAAVIDP